MRSRTLVIGSLASLLSIGGCAFDDSSGYGATPDLLVRVDDEPPGANCAEGGSAIHRGADANGNGALDDDEIDTTSYVCTDASGYVWEGDFDHFDDPEAVAQLAHVHVITGSLRVRGSGRVELPNLQLVGGDIVARDSDATALSLPALASVGGAIDIAGLDGLESLRLESLVRVGNQFYIRANSVLTELAAPALRSVGPHADGLDVASVFVVANVSLPVIELPALVHVAGDIALYGNDSAVAIALPALGEASGIVISDSPSLEKLNLLALTTTDHIELSGCPVLPSLEGFASLDHVTRNLDIRHLTALTDLHGLDALASISSLQLAGNHGLRSLAGLEHVRHLSGSLLIHANLDLQTLEGLDNLLSIGGDLVVADNRDLSSLDGLAELIAVDGDIEIDDNALSECDANAFVDRLVGEVPADCP